MPNVPTAHRSYSTASYASHDVPITFDIDGEEFKAYPSRCPGSVVLDFGLPDAGASTNPTLDFFRAVLSEDWDRFLAYLRQNPAVNKDMLRDIAAGLLEETAGLPTPPSDS